MIDLMQDHVRELIEKYEIFVEDESRWNFSWAEPEINTIAVPSLKVQNTLQYLTVLHEIAHCAFQHDPHGWDEEALCEVHAWVAAFHWSKVEVSRSLRMKFNEERIRHSCEKGFTSLSA